MGITCEIHLKTPTKGVYYGGDLVTGDIKYAVSENTVFKRISMSLKGIGTVRVKNKSSRTQRSTFNKEIYVNDTEIILDKSIGNGVTVNAGSYTVPFKFKIPERVPPSTNMYRRRISYDLKYKVAYFISMKFVRTGFMTFPKLYNKEIQVLSDITPTLSRDMLTYEEQKKLFHPFSSADSIVSLKSTILSSVVHAGDTVHLEYQVTNNSHVTISSVETKIVETVKPKKRRRYVIFDQDVPGTDSKTRSISVGQTQQLFVDIKIPEDVLTIDSCELATRSYVVKISVELPTPHMNFHLLMPIQVMLKRGRVDLDIEDAPPSYWDVMCEDKIKIADL